MKETQIGFVVEQRLVEGEIHIPERPGEVGRVDGRIYRRPDVVLRVGWLIWLLYDVFLDNIVIVGGRVDVPVLCNLDFVEVEGLAVQVG